MCNDYRLRHPAERLIDDFREIRIPLRFPIGIPNIQPRDEIKITDTAPVIRFAEGHGELLQMPWSWRAPTGKPVFNFRSEGRRFNPAERVLIPADGFYEFTKPDDPKKKLKDKWLFTVADTDLFAIAGIVKQDAFSMLTTEPGLDIARFHDRQIVILKRESWAAWLTGSVPEADLLKALPEGSLKVEQVG